MRSGDPYSLPASARVSVPGLGEIAVHDDFTSDIWKISDRAAVRVVFEVLEARVLAAVRSERTSADGKGGAE